MLQSLRDKTSGWFATIILGLLIIPFAFFGLEQYSSTALSNYAAKVQAPPKWWPSAPSWWPVSMLWQHNEIDANDFRRSLDQVRQQRMQAQGKEFDAKAFESMENKRAVLEQLIDQRVMLMAAERDGLVVGDAQLRDAIQQIPAFQANGKFDPQAYQYALATQQQTPRQFEELMREGLLESVIPQGIASSAFITNKELERLMRLFAETRDVAYAVMPAPAAGTDPVSDADIKAWYVAHPNLYRAPESVTLEYVEVDRTKLPSPAVPSEDVLRKRYQDEIAKFGTGEQRDVAHILVKAGSDAASQKAAAQKAADLVKQARAPGADFAALARANSDDAGSKAGGGELGQIQRDGSMVKPFEDAVFAMKAGEVSEPVKSDFGYHVILLKGITPGQQKTFEQAREELLAEQQAADRERAFNDLVGKLVDETGKNPTSLAGAAQAANVQVQTIKSLTRRPTGALATDPVASNAQVQRAAFSDSLIQDGTVSDPIQINPDHSVLVRVAAHQAERALPLDQVREQVVLAVRNDRSAKQAAVEADKVLAEVAAGKSLVSIADARKWQHAERPGVQRGMPVPDPKTAEAVFAVPAPASGKVATGKSVQPDASVILFAVSKVTPGDISKASPAERQALRQQIEQASAYDEVDSLRRALRKQVKVTVLEDRL